MRVFKDAKDRVWEIVMNINTIKRVRGLLNGVDLLKMDSVDGGAPLLTSLAVDIELLCDVIFACVKPQADLLGVTDQQFGELLGGDVITHAREAFFQELMDFFQMLGRTELVRAIQTQETLITNVVKRAEAKLAQYDPEKMADLAMENLDERLQSTFGRSSTSTQASAG